MSSCALKDLKSNEQNTVFKNISRTSIGNDIYVKYSNRSKDFFLNIFVEK